MSELVLDEVESDVEDDHEEREQIKRRGKDINWVLEDHYSNENDFMDSEFKNEMDKELTQKKRYRTNDSWAEHWVCKYFNKRGYLPCPRQLKVHYPHTCREIVIWSNEKNHLHLENVNYKTDIKYHWTIEQENIIRECIKNGRNNSLILTELKKKGASSAGLWPSLAQVGVKKRYIKKSLRKYVINDYNKMREICERNSTIPEDDHEAYIPFFTLTLQILLILILLLFGLQKIWRRGFQKK